jgi:hypothetical protein
MPLKIYIETTIPSAYHETRRDTDSVFRRNHTREWWDLYARTLRTGDERGRPSGIAPPKLPCGQTRRVPRPLRVRSRSFLSTDVQ